MNTRDLGVPGGTLVLNVWGPGNAGVSSQMSGALTMLGVFLCLPLRLFPLHWSVGQILMRGCRPPHTLIMDPCSHCRIQGASPSNALLPWERLVVRGFFFLCQHLVALPMWPFLGRLPIQRSAGQISIMRRCHPPLAPFMAPCSPRWWWCQPPLSPIVALFSS